MPSTVRLLYGFGGLDLNGLVDFKQGSALGSNVLCSHYYKTRVGSLIKNGDVHNDGEEERECVGDEGLSDRQNPVAEVTGTTTSSVFSKAFPTS